MCSNIFIINFIFCTAYLFYRYYMLLEFVVYCVTVYYYDLKNKHLSSALKSDIFCSRNKCRITSPHLQRHTYHKSPYHQISSHLHNLMTLN